MDVVAPLLAGFSPVLLDCGCCFKCIAPSYDKSVFSLNVEDKYEARAE